MKITRKQLRKIIKEEFGGHSRPKGGFGGISQALIDDYNSWVHKSGHVTPASSSVMASYLITKQMEEDHNAHQVMADFFGLSHEDIMRDIRRQQSERSALKESIRRMIREAMTDEPIRMIPGDSFDAGVSKSRRSKKTSPSEFRDTIVMSPAGDSVLVGGQETSPDNVDAALEVLSGQTMGYGDMAKLEALLKKQMASGYVEIPISWSQSSGWKF